MPGRRNKNKIEDEVEDITELTNKQLKTRLQELGIATGPIVDSTRKIYEKKLEKLLSKGSDLAYSTDEDGEPEEPHEDKDPETEQTEDKNPEPVRNVFPPKKSESKTKIWGKEHGNVRSPLRKPGKRFL
jgi:hypothetical protein